MKGSPKGDEPKGTGMKYELQLLWIFLFSMMLFVAFAGNIIVIWSVSAHRRMWTVTNIFLVNLSFSDLLITCLNCSFNFVYMMRNNWTFGQTLCMVNNYVANVTVAASVFTLTCITIDRYLAITTPLKPRMTMKCAELTIIGIWVLSLGLASPCLLYSTTVLHKESGMTGCVLQWPDGYSGTSKCDYVYNVILFLVTYLLPMSAMVCCYTAMSRVLWGSKAIGENTHRQLKFIKSKKKIVMMFLVIVFIFGVCWLPYHLYFIYIWYDEHVVYTSYIQHVYLAFYWLAMSNSMINPIIYYVMNQRFREYFRKAICEWRCDAQWSGIDRMRIQRSSDVDGSGPAEENRMSVFYRIGNDPHEVLIRYE